MSRATLESTKIISTITKFTSKAAALLAVNHAERTNADWGVSWRWEKFIKIRLIAVVIQREIVETGAKIWLHTILLSRIYLSRLLSTSLYQTLLSGSSEASPAESNLKLSSDISSSLSDTRFPSRFNYKPFKAIRSNLIFMLNLILDDETKLTIVWALKWIEAHFATLTGCASFVIRHNALFENSHDPMSGRKLFYFNRLWNIEFSHLWLISFDDAQWNFLNICSVRRWESRPPGSKSEEELRRVRNRERVYSKWTRGWIDSLSLLHSIRSLISDDSMKRLPRHAGLTENCNFI